jgi:hypothetical protein
MLEGFITLLGDGESVEIIIGAVVAILTAYKVPAWIGSLIIQFAPVAVKAVEMHLTNRPNEEKRAAAIKAVKQKLPKAVRTIPGIDKRIGGVVDKIVEALPETYGGPSAPSQKEMKNLLGS